MLTPCIPSAAHGFSWHIEGHRLALPHQAQPFVIEGGGKLSFVPKMEYMCFLAISRKIALPWRGASASQAAVPKFDRIILGCRAAIRKRARAGPSGARLPCSQFLKV